jgi:membrane protease YdiL (CAAX protease family)
MSTPTPPGTASPQPPPFQIRMPERKPLGAGKSLFIFFLYFGSQIVVSVIALAIVGLVEGPQALDDLDPGVFLVAGAAGILLGGLAVYVVARAYLRFEAPEAPLARVGLVRSGPKAILAGAAIGVAIALFFMLVVQGLFPPGEDARGPLEVAASAPGWPRIVFVLIAVVLAPVIEEFLFRGVMFTGMSRSWGPVKAGLVVTLLFGLLHVFDVAGYWPSLGVVTLAGLAMLLMRLKTGSLLPSIALHTSFNLVQVLALYLFQV